MMDEVAIADRLKQNISSPQTNTVMAQTDDSPRDQGYTADLGDALDIYKMYDFFGVETNFRDTENERKLQTVYRWAADKAQSTDYLAVAKVVMEYEQSMGNTSLGSRLERMHRYIKLDDQINRLKEEQGWL